INRRCVMRRFKSAVNSDDRTRNGALSARMMTSATLGLLSTVLLFATLLFGVKSADDIKVPAGYRNWFHVNTMIIDKASPFFDALGGMHIIHINSVGEAALKNGGPYPDQTAFVDHLREFTVTDGTYVEGPLKALVFMTKDKVKYATTGGWGWQAWAGGDPSKPLVTDATKQCFEGHQARKEQDYVYSTYIP